MTKEEFEQLRVKGELTYDLCYEYWNYTKPPEYTEFTLSDFVPVFQQFWTKFSDGSPIPVHKEGRIELKRINPYSLVEQIFSTLSKKFEA